MKARLLVLVLLLCLLFPLANLHAQDQKVLPIKYGQTVQGELVSPDKPPVYGFEGKRGDKVTIKVTPKSSGFQTGIILADRDAQVLDKSGEGTIQGFALPKDAVYFILIASVKGTGKFSLSLTKEGGSAPSKPSPTQSEPDIEESSGESRILFASNFEGNWEIYAVNPDGSDRQRLTKTKGDEYTPAWSPDGTQIAYHLEENGKVLAYVMDADGSNAHVITKGNYKDWRINWSPDGARFVVASGPAWNGSDIYTIDTDGSNRKLLVKSNNTAYYPSWSPDGKQIIFNRTENNQGNVDAISPNGGQITRLVKGATDGRWSPDGKTLAFANGDIWIMKNGKMTQLTKTQSYEWAPVWSPDGTQIAFIRTETGDHPFKTYVMDADGSNEIEISNNEGSSLDLSWSPK